MLEGRGEGDNITHAGDETVSLARARRSGEQVCLKCWGLLLDPSFFSSSSCSSTSSFFSLCFHLPIPFSNPLYSLPSFIYLLVFLFQTLFISPSLISFFLLLFLTLFIFSSLPPFICFFLFLFFITLFILFLLLFPSSFSFF